MLGILVLNARQICATHIIEHIVPTSNACVHSVLQASLSPTIIVPHPQPNTKIHPDKMSGHYIRHTY